MMKIDERLSGLLLLCLTLDLCLLATLAEDPALPNIQPKEKNPIAPILPGEILLPNATQNSSTSSSSSEASEELIVRKPAAVKFANANGQPDDEVESLEEFQDKQQRILRRENETQEELVKQKKELEDLRSSCFHVPEEICGEFKDNNSCPCKPHPFIKHSIVCCHVTNMQEASKCLHKLLMPHKDNYTQIHIRNATLKELDMNLGIWKSFSRISVTDGQISKLTRPMNKLIPVTCFNVSNNNITEIDPKMFKGVNGSSFLILDLSQNNLTQIPHVPVHQFPNLTINIRGNVGVRCKLVQAAVSAGVNFAEKNRSKCGTKSEFKWFDSSDLTPISQIYQDKELQKICPARCKCTMNVARYDDDTLLLLHTVQVECTHMELTELPDFLPPNTLHLNVSNNNITNLRGLNLHPDLIRLIADDNQISSLADMEGTEFKDNFEVLSLRGNKLKQIPIYLLTKTLERNPRGIALNLARNKLNCDCNTATELRLWLLGHKSSVKDYDEVECDNLPEKVIQLQETKLCQSKHDAMDYIFYLIAAEVLLLLALILKVSYDYYVFKTQSYLPWPANKMPKLPCDWLCES